MPESLTEDSDFDEMLPIEDEFLVEEKEELIVDKPEAEPADDEMMKRSVDEFDVEKEPVSQDKEIKQGDEQPESKISSEDRSVLEDELNELLEKAISFDEEIPEEIFEKQPENLEEETPSSGNEEGTDNAAETAEKKSGQGDDLLSFYERELAAMSDELSLTQKQTEKTDTQVSVEDSGPEDTLQEEKVKDENKAMEEDVDITEEDVFDLSIFEKIGEEDALKKDEAPPEENEETVSVKDKQLPVIEDENVKSASTDEEHFIEEESEPGDLPRSKELFSKEIVDEMIDDFFKDNNIEETKSTEQSIDLLAEESLTEMVNESQENLFDADDEKVGTEEPEEIDLINSKIDKLDVKNEISDVIEDIDNLLEEPDGAALDLPEIPDEKFTEPVSDGTAAEETEQETVPESSSDDFQFASTEDLDFEPEPEIKDEETKEITGEVKKDEQEEVIFESTEYTPQQSANEIPVRQKDMFTYLKKKEIKKIISNVFGGDDEDFVTTVERISGCNTYKEATEILKDVFFSYRVSPYSKEAVILTNAVSNFFRQV
ncbi:MAG TPA: hypothetical protein ENH47_03275 [Ignavibacteriales bacterium]|nr:hypothetical protein [Ignavibacteriales bacterium]